MIGCSKAEKPSSVSPRAIGTDGTNLNEVVFAVVDGRPLTAAFVKDTVLVMRRIKELGKRPLDPKTADRQSDAVAMKIVPQLISGMLLEKEVSRQGIGRTEKSDAEALAKYNRMTGLGAKNVDELVAPFDDLADVLRQQFNRESTFYAFYATNNFGQCIDAEVNIFLRQATNRFARAETINREAKEKGRKVIAELKAGQSWEEVARRSTEEDPEEDGAADYWKEWETFRLKDCIFPEIGKALVGKGVGDYTDPVDCDAGLVIAKVTNIDGDIYTCARILIRMAVPEPIPTREIARRRLMREKFEEQQRKLLQELRAKAKIEFPLGPKFKYAIFSKPQPMKPKEQRPRPQQRLKSILQSSSNDVNEVTK